VRAVLVVLISFVAMSTAVASRRDWAGSAACGSCHPKELAAWQKTAHATTASRWKGQRPPSKCLGCHGTGEAPAGPAIAVEVGCEACHGAGAAYGEDDIMRDRPLALALGMADLSTAKQRAAACAGCHARSVSGAPFDPTAPVHVVSP
jgi:hypothetical protein